MKKPLLGALGVMILICVLYTTLLLVSTTAREIRILDQVHAVFDCVFVWLRHCSNTDRRYIWTCIRGWCVLCCTLIWSPPLLSSIMSSLLTVYVRQTAAFAIAAFFLSAGVGFAIVGVLLYKYLGSFGLPSREKIQRSRKVDPASFDHGLVQRPPSSH